MAHVLLGGGGPQVFGRFVDRPNRFVLHVQLADGEVVLAHLADRGRLIETLIPGVTICLVSRPGAKKVTQWQAVAAQRADGSWASLDTLLPNRLMYAALQERLIPPLLPYTTVRREVQIGGSRFDFVLEGGPTPIVLEVKSAGRLVGSQALVPDAPSTRATRHVRELIELQHQGWRAVLVVVGQGAVTQVAIDGVIDPNLAETVGAAGQSGVDLIGISSRFDIDGLYFNEIVPLTIFM
jgi:sugar fermentation stimulation protein A